MLRRPLTLNAPSRGVFPVVSDVPPSLTPVVSSASDEYSREMSGSARVCSPLMTWLRWLESVSTSGERADDLDLLRHLADRHLQVDAQPRADLHLDVVDERDGETRSSRRSRRRRPA